MAHDPVWITVLLALHVAAGMLALVMAPLALATVKGSRAHRRWGKIYFWAMAAVALSALVIALYRPILFLAFLAVLGFYLAFSGYRVLSLKRLAADGVATPADWLAALTALFAGAALVGLGALRPQTASHMGVVAVVLGLVGMRAAASDLYRFAVRPKARAFWVLVHLEKFIGSYIAALTAFAVNVVPRVLPGAGLYAWLAPLTLGIPVIAFLTLRYRRRFAVTG